MNNDITSTQQKQTVTHLRRDPGIENHVIPGAQPALHFGGAIFTKFYSITFSCLFNRGTTFSQTVTHKVFFAMFPKMKTFQFWSVASRGLVMLGATAWLNSSCLILVLSSSVWCSLLRDIRCLWRHNMTSYSCLQTNVLVDLVDTTCIFFCTHSPYSYDVSLQWT